MMIIKKIWILFLFNFLCNAENAIVFSLNPGRIGDCLINYTKAKWVSWKYDLSLYVEKFSHIDKFILHAKEKHNFRYLRRDFKQVVALSSDDILCNQGIVNGTLYKTSYYFQAQDWGHVHDIHTWHGLYDNQEFRQLIRSLVKPKDNYTKIVIPQDIITVAVHVRKGCGRDPGVSSNGVLKKRRRGPVVASDRGHPLKFPPDHFYIDSLRLLLDHIDNQQIYVQIFTDHTEPQKIIDYYKKCLNDQRVVFADAVYNYFIADMFDMSLFDCLIRPDSSFSKISELVGNHTIVMCPLQSAWKENKLIITKIRLKDREYVQTFKKDKDEKDSNVYFSKCSSVAS